MNEFDLGHYLRTRGVDPVEVAAAEAEGAQALRRLGYAAVLLGGTPDKTASQVADAAGASLETAEAFWRAMGFADLPADAVALTDADVDALGAVNAYLQSGEGGPEATIRFTRLMGQSMGRMAEALVAILESGVDDVRLGLRGAPEDLGVLAADVLTPLIEQELVYLLRRHLYAMSTRRLAEDDADRDMGTIGFADVVQFTRLSGQMSEGDLAQLLEEFESETTTIITQRGGRVIKLIGDAVMFATDVPHDAAHIALDLIDRFGGTRPELRVGLAHGPTIARQGDLFGPTVNLASRLVGFARPGTVLIDRSLADQLADDDAFALKSLRPRDLKGIGETPMFVVRRATS